MPNRRFGSADTEFVASTAEKLWQAWLPVLGSRSRELDPETDQLIEDSRERIERGLERRERRASLAIGGSFLLVALAMLVFIPSGRSPSPLVFLALLLAFAVAARIEFEIGTGVALPTQLVLVPMLFLLPIGAVPLTVAAGLFLSRLGPRPTKASLSRVPVDLVSSWYAVGPAAVLALAGEPGPAWSYWPVFLGAIGAQFALDFGSSAAHEHLARGFSPTAHIGFMRWIFLVDACLAPIGLLIAARAVEQPLAFLVGMPLVGLLAIFARERRVRIDQALELSHAYRGTAFLLGDVVEADDEYTGSHSRDVVDLVVAVADDLGLGARTRRDAEFTALLHDVGKIRIPGEIINKPGPLTDEERAIINRHTLQGEEMLERVGGLLGDVGRLVRSCHERYDGHGYPDGLAGEEIPLVARIVACCDAYSAMTTDRAYRPAKAVDDALAELSLCAGTQFDPIVVESLQRVVAGLR